MKIQSYRVAVEGMGLRSLLVGLLMLGVTGCSDMMDEMPEMPAMPEEPTKVGAIAGSAVGLGLGAVIGSQTGDALGGAAIGAAAGAGAGYAVGGVIEDRDQRYASQEEALARQEATLNAQRTELSELRGLAGDSVVFRGAEPRANYGAGAYQQPGVGGSSYGSGTGTAQNYRARGAGGKNFVDPASLKNPFAAGEVPQGDGYQGGAFQGAQAGEPARYGSQDFSRQEYAGQNFGGQNLGSTGSYGGFGQTGGQDLSGEGLSERSLVGEAPSIDQPSSAALGGNTPEPVRVAPIAKIPHFDGSREGASNQVASLSGGGVVPEVAPSTGSAVESYDSGAVDSGAVDATAGTGEEVRDSKTGALAAQGDLSDVGNSESMGIAVEMPAAETPKGVNSGVANEELAEVPAVQTTASTQKLIDGSDDCQRASSEAKRGSSADSTADKLFYYRRALRLCPDAPEWHVELAKVYSSLGRHEDAKFEYEEALRIKADFEPARTGLAALSQKIY